MTEREKNRAEYDRKRAEYLERSREEGAHQEFYEWLSDFVGLPEALIPATETEVNASEDPHLNNIPLVRWDNMDGAVRRYGFAKLGAWSLCETVCCLKAMARRRQRRALAS